MWRGDSRVSAGRQLENANSKRKGRRVALCRVVIACAFGEIYDGYKAVQAICACREVFGNLDHNRCSQMCRLKIFFLSLSYSSKIKEDYH